ncbi:MAG: Gx transporter family protein [Candidatus Atribacteria bacterium]|nr:Gx transporter family protein [Candidatus Atribacteria bacterium]
MHWIENFFPPLLPLPGAKLGLANVVPLVLLLSGRTKEAVWINILRIFLGSFLGGNFLSIPFLMSLAGGVTSLLSMVLIHRRVNAPLWISVGGAFFHNLGQWWVAFLWVRSAEFIWYLPILLILSLPAGFLVGYLGILFRREEMEAIWRHLR